MGSRNITVLLLLGTLFFVWPIPDTIALRYLLMASGLAILAPAAFRHRADFINLHTLRMPLTWLSALTIWIIAGATLVSPEPSWSLSEIRGQWLTGLAALLLGFLAASPWISRRTAPARLLMGVVFAGLLVHVLYVDYLGLAQLVLAGTLPRRVAGLTEGMDKSNYLTNMLMAFLLAETFFRASFGKRTLPLSSSLLAAIMVATLFSSYLEAVRNGMIGLIIMSLSLTGLYLYENRGRHSSFRLGLTLFAIIATAGIFSALYAQSDPRWKSFLETVPIALDTEHHKAWLDRERHPYPTLADGTPVQASNYERVAWIKEGMLLIADHPLGIGYGRNAFGHALHAKYGVAGVGHSHSGLIDLGVGTGIPGMLLWLGFIGALLHLAWKRYSDYKNYYALVLLFVVAGFFSRMLVDSINRDHMLQQFLFLVGLLAAIMHKENEPLASS